MNKFDKKIMDFYIKSNKTKEFVSKKPTHQEVLYFAKHSDKNDLSSLTEYVINSNNLNLVVDYVMYAKKLSLKDNTEIVHCILSSGNSEYISRLARYAENLTDGHIILLTKSLVETKCYAEMIRYYVDANNLVQHHKEMIFNAILESNNNKAITDFMVRVSELSEDNISKLINALDSNELFEYNRIIKLSKLSKNNKYELLLKVFDTRNVAFIFEFILNSGDLYQEYENIIFDKFVELKNVNAITNYYCDIMVNNEGYEDKVMEILNEANDAKLALYLLTKKNLNNIDVLESIILKSNDKKLIAKYLLLIKNKDLAKEIFGDLMYFYIFCKDVLEMDIKLDEFKSSLEINANEEYIKYVDDNIENYNKGVAPSKKN